MSVMIAPKVRGTTYRSNFEKGGSVQPAWSPSSRMPPAKPVRLPGLGQRHRSPRMIVETTYKEETETIVGEQVVLCGGLTACALRQV